jgi:hypothetical protein
LSGNRNLRGVEFFRTGAYRLRGQPGLLYKGCRVYFPEVKRPRRGVDHAPNLAPSLKKG